MFFVYKMNVLEKYEGFNFNLGQKEYRIPFGKNFISLLDKTIKDKNRTPDYDRIDIMVNEQKEYYNQYKRIKIYGVITLCQKLNNELHLTDGQHRCEVYKKLFKFGIKDKDTYIIFHVIEINSNNDKDIEKCFENINKNTLPVEKHNFSDKKPICEYIKNILKEKWKNRISTSDNNKYFTINPDKFCNFLTENNLIQSDWNKNKCEEILVQWNNILKDYIKLKDKDKFDKCDVNKFYLGIWIIYKKEIIKQKKLEPNMIIFD